MQLDGTSALLLRRRAGFVVDHENFGLKKRTFLVDAHDFEAAAAFGDQVEAAVWILLHHGDDFGGASNLSQSLFYGAYDAESAMLREAFADHFLIARLENVQGQGNAGEQDHIEREQGEKGFQRISGGGRGIRRQNRAALIVPQPLTSQVTEEYKRAMELSGKVVAVTGASMGIGEAIAKIFADHGASLALLSRDASRVEAARGRIGNADRSLALACDVRHREDIDRAIGLTLHHFKRIDVWVNNAGHGLLDSVAQVDMAACREMFDTNFFGAVMAMQAVIPVMRQQGGGSIINISSVAGHIPLPFHAAYSASKFALNAMGKAAGVELKNDGIHVLTVCPGYVRTEFSKNAVRGNELKRVRAASVKGITAERVARATLRGYLKRKREVIVPWTMYVPQKIYQLFPGLVEWSMRKMSE